MSEMKDNKYDKATEEVETTQVDADHADEAVADDQHAGYVPTEADYERARTEGAGNQPELPAGVVRKGGRGGNSPSV